MAERPNVKILFVCTANICRSLYAEGRARQQLTDDSRISVMSGGTMGLRNRGLDRDMADELRSRGEIPPDLISKRMTSAMVAAADVILAAEGAHRSFILDEWPNSAERVFTLHQFTMALRAVPARLWPDDAIRAAFDARGPVDPTGDVPDPFRRGPHAAAVTARIIDEHLNVVLPRLRCD